MFDDLRRLFSSEGLPPHGYCLLWEPGLVWTHVASDALIALAYFSIPVALLAFVRRRGDVAFTWVFWCFAAFITFCGLTHLMSIWTLWNADYGVEGLMKAATAVVSVGTAVMLWPLLPRAVALPSPTMLRAANDQLAARIAERDAALEAARREAAERARAEDALRQAQKLEAVGQLTSGVAHDFNNLLTAIIGNLDLLDRRVAGDATARRAVDNAIAGAERAAALTGRLLAFARRQPLTPQPLDLAAVVEELRDLLHGSTGGRVRLELDVPADLPPALADRNQLENALINLAVNARDAMPDGGRLTIRARERDLAGDAELPDGRYLALEVEDEGAGMDADTLARAFDPFFTTKALGQGTGLGLSQVYGFARQSGGRAEIVSRPGHGTRVTILLLPA